MRRLATILVAGACCAAAQTLTPRQLFYEDEKPAPKAAAPAAPAPKAAPKKKAAPKAVKIAPKTDRAPGAETAAATGEAAVPAAVPAPPLVTTAAYTTSDRALGLRYSVVQVAGSGESEVSPSAAFRAGDMVRVKVEANRDGYLYVIARGSSGNWKPLFPAPDIEGGDNRIAAHRPQRLPSNTQAFTFDEQAGQEQLFVVLSAEPVTDIDALIPSLGKPASRVQPGKVIMASAALNDEFVSRLRNAYSRDLIVQTVTPSQPADAGMPENAVYVMSQTGGRVVADIRLEHR